MKICGSHRHSYPNGDLVKDKRIGELEAALREMTSNQIHDALCQVFEEWENPHAAYKRAREVLLDLDSQ